MPKLESDLLQALEREREGRKVQLLEVSTRG